MSKTTWSILLAALAVGLPADAKVPDPSEVRVAWQLEITVHGRPEAIRVKAPGGTEYRTFWFLRYTATNRSGQDQMFVPHFTLYTEAGQVLKAGQGVPPGVFEAIKKLYPHALLTDPIDVPGKLLQGEDNARSSVAIWRDLPEGTGGFEVFVEGFSGETASVTLPAPVEMTELDPWTGETVTVRRRELVLAKTLQLSYELLGSGEPGRAPNVRAAGRKWIMR